MQNLACTVEDLTFFDRYFTISNYSAKELLFAFSETNLNNYN